MLPRIDRVVTVATAAGDDGPRVETTTWLLGDEEQVLVVDAASDEDPSDRIAGALPERELHLVTDDYATHEKSEVRAWPAENPRIRGISPPPRHHG